MSLVEGSNHQSLLDMVSELTEAKETAIRVGDGTMYIGVAS